MKFYFLYILYFFRTLSFKKIRNVVLSYREYYLSTYGRKIFIHTSKPTALSVEPINRCNLHCPECLTGSNKLMRRKGKISLDDFKKIVDEIHKDVCYLSLYFQGEPFMHPDFFQLVDYAKKNKIFISTSTNGHFLSEKNILSLIHSRLDLLIISLDGVTAESYEKYRKGGDFEKVVENIKSLTKKKKEYGVKYPLIELQFIVFKHNEKEIKDFKNLAGNLNVDKVTIKTAQIYSHDPEILPSSENKYSRYRYDESGNLFLLKKNKRGCSRQWSQCVITWEGEMAPCCFDKEASFSFGNVLANGVYPIWENQKNILFRQNIIKKRYPSLCKDCPEI